MYLALLMIVTGLSVSAVAAYYSIAGLIAIFAASPISIGVMGTVLEVAKLVAASWVYRNWNNAPKLLKWYFVTAVSVLIMITSLGIFGFLSKAHVDQTISIGGNNSLRIESIERRIENERRKIGDATTGIEQIDQQVQRLIDYDRIRGPSGAIETRKSSSAERESLNDIITQSYTAIESLEDEVMPLRKERLNLESGGWTIKIHCSLCLWGNRPRNLRAGCNLGYNYNNICIRSSSCFASNCRKLFSDD